MSNLIQNYISNDILTTIGFNTFFLNKVILYWKCHSFSRKMTLRKKKGRGEKKNRGWYRKKDDKFSSERKEKREIKRRKKRKEEEILEEQYAVPLEGTITAKKIAIFRRMEYVLSTVKSSARYGPRSKQNVDFSACIGYTSNTLGLNGFKTPHNLRERKHLGIYLFRPENRRSPWWLKEMWELSQVLVPLYDKNFGKGTRTTFLPFHAFLLSVSANANICFSQSTAFMSPRPPPLIERTSFTRTREIFHLRLSFIWAILKERSWFVTTRGEKTSSPCSGNLTVWEFSTPDFPMRSSDPRIFEVFDIALSFLKCGTPVLS